MKCPQCQEALEQDSVCCDFCGTDLYPENNLAKQTLSENFLLGQKATDGRYGVLYHAQQIAPRRPVEVKVLKRLFVNPSVAKRFLKEMRLVQSLQHPSAEKVYGSGQTKDGLLWVAIEPLGGQTLAERLQKKPISVEELLSLLGPICEALDEAHNKGLVHGNLNPSQLMLSLQSGALVPKLLGLGIAQPLINNPQGARIGDDAYRAPERWQNAPADRLSDLYSMAFVCYRALTGRFPFSVTPGIDWKRTHLTQAPLSLEQAMPANTQVSASLREVIMNTLAKDPSKRPYKTALAFKDALKEKLAPTVFLRQDTWEKEILAAYKGKPNPAPTPEKKRDRTEILADTSPKCRNCGTELERDAVFCDHCGKTIVLKPTPQPARVEPPHASSGGNTKLLKGGFTLEFINGARVHYQAPDEIKEEKNNELKLYYVGRTNPAKDWEPAIDLTPYDGEIVVSRRHACFYEANDGSVYLEDLESSNHCFINGKRLKRRELLKKGDKLAFGRVVVFFRG